MIEDYINRYLAGNKAPDADILAEMGKRFISVTVRQFMEQKESRAGSYPPSAATKCPRANYGAFTGVPAEPFDPQTLLKFWMGDLTELGIFSLAQLAFAGTSHSIGQNNAQVEVPIGTPADGKTPTINGYIDGLLNFNHKWHEAQGRETVRPGAQDWVGPDGSEDLIVEFKSMDEYPFKLFKESGPDDTFGYLGQLTMYQRALKVRRFIMVAMCKGTGEIAEHIGVYDRQYAVKADAHYDQVMTAIKMKSFPPGIPDGKNYGADPRDGKLRLNCRFCSRKEWCYGLLGYGIKAVMEAGYKGKVAKQYYAVHALDKKPAEEVQYHIDDIVKRWTPHERGGLP